MENMMLYMINKEKVEESRKNATANELAEKEVKIREIISEAICDAVNDEELDRVEYDHITMAVGVMAGAMTCLEQLYPHLEDMSLLQQMHVVESLIIRSTIECAVKEAVEKEKASADAE